MLQNQRVIQKKKFWRLHLTSKWLLHNVELMQNFEEWLQFAQTARLGQGIISGGSVGWALKLQTTNLLGLIWLQSGCWIIKTQLSFYVVKILLHFIKGLNHKWPVYSSSTLFLLGWEQNELMFFVSNGWNNGFILDGLSVAYPSVVYGRQPCYVVQKDSRTLNLFFRLWGC